MLPTPDSVLSQELAVSAWGSLRQGSTHCPPSPSSGSGCPSASPIPSACGSSESSVREPHGIVVLKSHLTPVHLLYQFHSHFPLGCPRPGGGLEGCGGCASPCLLPAGFLVSSWFPRVPRPCCSEPGRDSPPRPAGPWEAHQGTEKGRAADHTWTGGQTVCRR